MSEELVNKLTSVEQEQASIQSRTSALNDRLNEFESNSVSIIHVFFLIKRVYLKFECFIN
jgi:hypothetical protein